MNWRRRITVVLTTVVAVFVVSAPDVAVADAGEPPSRPVCIVWNDNHADRHIECFTLAEAAGYPALPGDDDCEICGSAARWRVPAEVIQLGAVAHDLEAILVSGTTLDSPRHPGGGGYPVGCHLRVTSLACGDAGRAGSLVWLFARSR